MATADATTAPAAAAQSPNALSSDATATTPVDMALKAKTLTPHSPTAVEGMVTPTTSSDADAAHEPAPAAAEGEHSSPSKPRLELHLDKVDGREHQPSLETDGSDDYSSDLGTPLGFHEGGSFGESAEDFSSHRFIGPSSASDDASTARELHGLRRVQIHAKPPRFMSDLASVESLRRKSSSSTSQGSSRSQSTTTELGTYSVSFEETAALGFATNVVVTQGDEVVVQVASVEPDMPASRAGVLEGDILLSVNGQKLEPHMAEADVLEIVRSASSPRTMVFQRGTAHRGSEPSASDAADEEKAKQQQQPKAKKSTRYSRFSSAVSYGSSILGSALKRKQKVVHPNSFCDGCGMDPICGALYTCSVCANYNLCGDCYELGTHGLENTDAMQALNEAIVQHKLQKKCKRFTDEFLMSLRRDICKGRPDKFEYLGGWIADIVVGTAASKITVRGIEIPALTPMARQRFVSNLMPLVSNRTDIEVNIEWLPDDAERASVDIEDVHVLGAAEHDDREKLRIWISDKKARTTSPFA